MQTCKNRVREQRVLTDLLLKSRIWKQLADQVSERKVSLYNLQLG